MAVSLSFTTRLASVFLFFMCVNGLDSVFGLEMSNTLSPVIGLSVLQILVAFAMFY